MRSKADTQPPRQVTDNLGTRQVDPAYLGRQMAQVLGPEILKRLQARRQGKAA